MTEYSLFTFHFNAGVAELADAQDLGSCVTDVGVQVPSPAPYVIKSRPLLRSFCFFELREFYAKQ